MTIIKEVLRRDVKKAVGCTEPGAVAFACSLARQTMEKGSSSASLEDETKIKVMVDPGTLKNGTGVGIANAGGEKGNAMAAALGYLCGDSALGLEVLSGVTIEAIEKAKTMISQGKVSIQCKTASKGLHIEVLIIKGEQNCSVLISDSHTNVTEVRLNGQIITCNTLSESRHSATKEGRSLKESLQKMTIAELMAEASNLDEDDRAYIKLGVETNLLVSEQGLQIGKCGNGLKVLQDQGIIGRDVVSNAKIITASATDARMSGSGLPVMSSGGSGNQGIVAILCPYVVGKQLGVAEEVIIESIALSHLVNAYVKCFTGILSPTCGCGIAAGAGAAAGIVYQHQKSVETVSLAINSVIADIAGILCDGAKGGCALKVASATASAIKSAFFAINGFGAEATDGIIGNTAEETIRNLGEVSQYGLAGLDMIVLGIIERKSM